MAQKHISKLLITTFLCLGACSDGFQTGRSVSPQQSDSTVHLYGNSTAPSTSPSTAVAKDTGPNGETMAFTANGNNALFGNASTFSVNVGDTINYAWHSAGINNLTSTFSLNADDACGNKAGKTGTWVASSLIGDSSGQVAACQAGVTYTLTLIGTSAYTGASLELQQIITVNPLATKPVVQFAGNGKTSFSISPQQFIDWDWNVQNANRVEAYVELTATDKLGTQINKWYPWVPDTGVTGHRHDQVLDFQLGASYVLVIRGINDNTGEYTDAYVNVSVVAAMTDAEIAAVAERQKMNQFIFGQPNLPSAVTPASFQSKGSTQWNFRNQKQIDVMKWDMGRGYTATVYIFRPQTDNNRLAIFQQGHEPNLTDIGGNTAIQFFLDRGYTVVGLYMPLFGPNPSVVQYNGHDPMFSTFPSSEPGSALKYFLAPVALSLNYMLKENPNYSQVVMTGVSGGGWTTTVYAALDPRVQLSFPVSGSLPLSYNTGRDEEQNYGPFYNQWPYEELYYLAGLGKNRVSMQILTKNDSCCFPSPSASNPPYADQVQARLKQADSSSNAGQFLYRQDATHTAHSVSGYALSTYVDPILSAATH